MTNEREIVHVGELVILVALPAGFVDDLPEEDQRAISAMVGKPVRFLGYDEDGRAELDFDNPFDRRTEHSWHTHTIWVGPDFVARIEP
jgi:hypothetical protein